MTRLLLLAGLFLVLSPAQAARPNVLFIAVDDLRPALGCYDDPIARTPQIDRLAARGTVFSRAYCQQALCAPSRASVMTGLRPDTTGITDLSHPVRKTRPEVLTLPQHLRAQGYTTLSLGKIYHHLSDDNGTGWSRPAWEVPGPWELPADPANGPEQPGGRNRPWECVDVPDDFYPDGKVAAEAVAELGRLKTAGKPFFLAVGFHKPHLPFFAPKRYWALYSREQIRLPDQQVWPEQMPELATTNSAELRNYRGMPKTGPIPAEDARALIHGYYASVSYADAMIGRVLEALEREGLADSTLVVFWGDHGWKLADYGAWCKHTNLEIDARAPLIVASPWARTRGVTSPALVELVDLFPTIADACGVPIPAAVEGTSLRPLLDDPTREWKRAAFTQYPQGRHVMGHSIRDTRWRYTEWTDRRDGMVVARELYDHRDNRQVVEANLAADPAHRDEVTRLSALLDGGRGWRQAKPPTP